MPNDAANALVPAAPSDAVLSEIPARALKFLSYLARNPAIYTILAQSGLEQRLIDRAWENLLAVSGYRGASPAAPVANAASAALAELDQWDEPGFRKARASLKHNHPAEFAFVFADLAASTGPEAALGVELFLDRLDALESGADRKGTRKADHAALKTLAERGITPEERARLRKLCEAARTVSDARPPDPTVAEKDDQRRAKLIDLYKFFDEWSEIARTEITRRDHLINLGLGKRKARKPASPPPAATAPSAPAPAPTNGAS